ncbi:MAG TPA: hypothetical protein VE127_01970 [Solirubrobacteraceae bacterium]|nr:hypothetical protein [Solirubrobacteraceae bacterium]
MTITHQTVKLARGRHSAPERGACVMELASMLAGGPFTDHPRSACPVIGAFLRAYNDWVDDRRRQDLYAYAAEVVDSRASRDVEKARAKRLIEWAEELETRRLKRFVLGRGRRMQAQDPRPDDIASRVLYAIARQKDHPHQEALALIDELLGIGQAPTRHPVATSDHLRPNPAIKPHAGVPN